MSVPLCLLTSMAISPDSKLFLDLKITSPSIYCRERPTPLYLVIFLGTSFFLPIYICRLWNDSWNDYRSHLWKCNPEIWQFHQPLAPFQTTWGHQRLSTVNASMIVSYFRARQDKMRRLKPWYCCCIPPVHNGSRNHASEFGLQEPESWKSRCSAHCGPLFSVPKEYSTASIHIRQPRR